MAERQRLLLQPINPDRLETRDMLVYGAPVRWLDEQHVYVSLYDYYDLPSELRERFPFTRNIIANVDTGGISSAKHIPNHGFCYFKGYVSYTFLVRSDQVFYEGAWGEEKEVLRRATMKDGRHIPIEQRDYVDANGKVWPASTGFFFNKFNCRLEKREGVNGFTKYPLLDGHGYVLSEFGPERLVYYPAGTNVASVPLTAKSGDFGSATYSESLDAYVVPVRLQEASSRSRMEVWFFKPTGEAQMKLVPGGPWFGAARIYRVSRAGIVLWSNNNVTSPGDGFAGIYLVGERDVVRIAAGLTSHPEVSPDGCRIAFGVRKGSQSVSVPNPPY